MAASQQKKACVHFGISTRIVHFESSSACDDLREVSKAIKMVFKLDQSTKLLVQAQSDPEWKEKWFDIIDGEEIPDKSELRIVVAQVCQFECSYIEARH